MKKNNLTYIRVPLSYDGSVGDALANSEFIFNLSGEYIYVVYYGESAIDPYGNDDLNHKLTYYLNPEEYNPIREDYDPEYFGLDYQPNFERVYVSTQYTYFGGNYAILKVYDAKTLNFLLTTNNDESVSIFSGDYDLYFLEKYIDGYYESGENDFSYNYICNRNKEYIESKKFIFFDTYSDDEDNELLCISKNKDILEKVKIFWVCDMSLW